MPCFSVIIPIFNAEQTLLRCLASVSAQTFSDFEVLAADNGSSDKSREIMREYAARDDRFKFIEYSERRGPSAARNRALEEAGGKYIAFVDSDDFVEADWLLKMKDAFESEMSEAVFIGYNKVDANGDVFEKKLPRLHSGDIREASAQLYLDDMFGYTWIKSFKREVISDTVFCNAVSLLEDEIFTCEVLERCSRISIVEAALYNYTCGTSGQLTSRLHREYCHVQKLSFDEWRRLFGDASYARYLSEIAERKLSSCMYYGFERDVDAREFFSELCGSSLLESAAEKTAFAEALRDGDMSKIMRLRRRYRLKNKLYAMLRR